MTDHFIICECFAEGLRLNYDAEDKTYYLSIWYQGRRHYSWTQRLRHVWKILRTGTPYEDQICLRPDQAQRLAGLIMKETPDA